MNVLSLFDGMSCLQLALQRLGVKVDNYYASEIDKYAIQATKNYFPNTIHIGDVTKVKGSDIPKMDLLGGGSPCQGFSFAGKGLNFNDPRSKLFFEFVRILNECREKNPDIKFLLENVMMKEEHEKVITKLLGVNPIRINSALVSAHSRDRLYWTNIGLEPQGLFGHLESIIQQPKDKGIVLKDILEDEVDEKYYLSEKALARIQRSKYSHSTESGGKQPFQQNRVYHPEGKMPALSAELFGRNNIAVVNDINGLREIGDKSMNVDGNYFKGMDNHGQRTMIVCARMTGRYPENPKSRKAGLPTEQMIEQMIEPRFDQKTGSITTVQKDNLIIHSGHPRTGSKNKKGGTGPLSRDDGKTYCIDTQAKNNILEYQRIRRLTPTECLRLQTCPDDFFIGSRVSETQQYKMLGNGWTIDVIVHILSYLKTF